MDKEGFVKSLVNKTELNDEQATKFIEAFTKVMADYFRKGEKVVIAEFGSFYVKENKEVQFNPSSKLKELFN
jgi:nucleoid DNA-binding protein